jgi:ferric-dicitrate binding protein FerR (iron transport regulator)
MTDHRRSFDAEAIASLDAARREEVLTAYLDDELSPAAARRVTAWLDDHPEALRSLEHRRRVWGVLDLYEDPAVPEGFAARVLARAGVRFGHSRGVPRWTVGLVAAAAVAVLAIGIVLRRPPVASTPEVPGHEVARVFDEVPPELLEDVDLLLSLSDEEFQGVLLEDLETP